MFRDYTEACQDPDFTQVRSRTPRQPRPPTATLTALSCLLQVVELDLSSVVPCCSGPKRPQDRVPVADMKKDFESCLGAKVGDDSPGESCLLQEENLLSPPPHSKDSRVSRWRLSVTPQ